MTTVQDIQTLINKTTSGLSYPSIETVSSIITNNTAPDDAYNTIVRKIDYREIEHNKLKQINTTINIVYYILVLLLFILLYADNNLLLTDRFLFYILLLLIPYIYPWVFSFFKKIWNEMFPEFSTQGPKNAFLNNIDTNIPDYTDVPYNI